MKKSLYFLFFLFVFTVSANAQVTIGSLESPVKGAILELKSNSLGFLPPRVPLNKLSLPTPLPNHVEGMVVFNTKNSPADTLKTGLYYNTGTRWMRLATAPSMTESWFYMPSTAFDTSNTGTGFTVNLYDEFIKQFNNSNPVKNASAPAPVLSILPKATDLNFYVIGYDNTVFNNIFVSDNGVMKYDIIGSATDATYLNIVFVVK